jgi:hypothetical protein
MGITRCGAIEVSFTEETELDRFSEHFTYPLIFSALEIAFEVLADPGYAPEVALAELHGSGELGEVLSAAAREGLYRMIETHASPACQVGISHHWESSVGGRDGARQRAEASSSRSGLDGFCSIWSTNSRPAIGSSPRGAARVRRG